MNLVVGAPNSGSAPFASAGKAYVYTRQTSGTWILSATLVPALGDVANAKFGSDVSCSGTRIAVSEDESQFGYVFLKNASGYSQQVKITHPYSTTSKALVRLSNDWLWFTKEDRYCAYQFIGAAWVLKQTLTLGNDDRGCAFSNGLLAVKEAGLNGEIRVRAWQLQGTQPVWTNFYTTNPAVPTFNHQSGDYSVIAIDGDRIAVSASNLAYGSVGAFGAGFLFDAIFNDCNGNGMRDECDIALATSFDVNTNGIPDECENLCVSDINRDGRVDGLDLSFLLSAWGNCP